MDRFAISISRVSVLTRDENETMNLSCRTKTQKHFMLLILGIFLRIKSHKHCHKYIHTLAVELSPRFLFSKDSTTCAKISRQSIFTARCYASAVYAVMQCPSVRPSVTFVDHVKTNKHIFEIFSPSGSDTILVFPNQRGCRYSDGNPPNGGVECKGN